MVIDINNISPQPPGKPRNGVADGATGDANSKKPLISNNDASTGTADTVNLSNQAKELNRVQQALQQLPEVDIAKVEAIQAQIASGTYPINTAQLADKIIANDASFNL